MSMQDIVSADPKVCTVPHKNGDGIMIRVTCHPDADCSVCLHGDILYVSCSLCGKTQVRFLFQEGTTAKLNYGKA
jgi:hypothetical protein